MKTVRNNPCHPHRVYIEIVFTLLCKHLLQDGTLKCEQNSTSPLLDAAVLLGSDKQLEWGAVLSACSSCCHCHARPPALPPSNLGIFSSSSSSSQGTFPNLIQKLERSNFSTFCGSRCQVCSHTPSDDFLVGVVPAGCGV